MPKSLNGSPGVVRVFAHNPSPLMTKSSGRKTAPKKSTSKRSTSTARKPAARKPAARRNPAPASRTGTRRNPSFVNRAMSAYGTAGAAVLGGVAGEQAQNFILKAAAGKVPGAAIAAALAPGALGVYLMGTRSQVAKNIGLGMVITSAANTLGAVTSMIGLGATATPAASGAAADTASRALSAPRARMLAAAAPTKTAAGCGCHPGQPVTVAAGNGL